MPKGSIEYPGSMRASMGSRSSASTLQNGYISDEDQISERNTSPPNRQDEQEGYGSAPEDAGHDGENSDSTTANGRPFWDTEPEPWVPAGIGSRNTPPFSSGGIPSQAIQGNENGNGNRSHSPEPAIDWSAEGVIEDTDSSAMDSRRETEEFYRGEGYNHDSGQEDYQGDDDRTDFGGDEQHGWDDNRGEQYEQDDNEGEDQSELEITRL